jgi:hypothetical protein
MTVKEKRDIKRKLKVIDSAKQIGSLIIEQFKNILPIIGKYYPFNDPHSDHQSVTSCKMLAYKKAEDH